MNEIDTEPSSDDLSADVSDSLMTFDLRKVIARLLGDLTSIVKQYHELWNNKGNESELRSLKTEIFQYLQRGILYVLISADQSCASCFTTEKVIDRIVELGNSVTEEQIITMLVRAMGYEPEDAEGGGWASGYILAAVSNGIIESAESISAAMASRKIVAQFFFNALFS